MSKGETAFRFTVVGHTVSVSFAFLRVLSTGVLSLFLTFIQHPAHDESRTGQGETGS